MLNNSREINNHFPVYLIIRKFILNLKPQLKNW